MIELNSKSKTKVKSLPGRGSLAVLALMASSSVLLLSGCSSAFHSTTAMPSGGVQVENMAGKVHGGQQPVSGATVQIYEVSVAGSGYGAAATPVAEGGTTVTATTDSGGSWSYGAYTCASESDELYVVASGGNPGVGATNSALSLMAVVGTCQQAHAGEVPFVFIDEVTTVATAYSLAGFMTDLTHVSTSTTNTVGLTNAFQTFGNLANLSTGAALTATPAYTTLPTNSSPDVFRSIVPYDTVNTLADILAACVNTNGGGAACSSLFALTGGATDTASAALYIAHNPALVSGGTSNVGSLYALLPAQAPFQPTLTAQPNDFTLTLNFIGGGLGGINGRSRSGAQYIAIDGSGNVWLPNTDRVSVTELNNLGAPLSPTTTTNQTAPFNPLALGGWGASAGVLESPQEVAIDQSGNAWVADAGVCLAAFSPAGSFLSGSPFTSACPSGQAETQGISVDANNQVWISGSTFITATNDTGALVTGFPVTSATAGFNTLSQFLGADNSGHTWYLDAGNNHYGALNANGTTFTTSASSISGPGAFAAFGTLATSAGGNSGLALIVPEGGGGTLNVQPINVTGAINTLPNAILPNSEAGPEGIAADGSSNYYFANDGGPNGAITVPENISVLNNKGALISPADTGYTGGTELTVLGAPVGVAVDQSGNVWVVNTINNNPSATGQLGPHGVSGASNVTEFVGLGAPAQPVFSSSAKNSTYGVKP